MAAKRDEAGRFLPGESGNPSGRSPVFRRVVELARAYTGEAIDKLAALARGTETIVEAPATEGSPEVVRVERVPYAVQHAAAKTLIEFGWGRAPETLGLVETPDEELAAEIRRRHPDIAALAEGRAEEPES